MSHSDGLVPQVIDVTWEGIEMLPFPRRLSSSFSFILVSFAAGYPDTSPWLTTGHFHSHPTRNC